MAANPSKKYSKSISSKLIVAVLLGGIAVLTSWIITRTTFDKVLDTVNRISKPNEKLKLVNNIFKDVIKLDQLQREQSLNNSVKPYNPYIDKSKQLQLRLDTLRALSENNAMQVDRIDSMKVILTERDKLFLNYLQLRANLVKNDTLTQQIKSLSSIITNASANTDSSVVTTEKKITTTTLQPVDSANNGNPKNSFWDRLLGRKKERDAAKVQKLIVEELNIKIDTLALAKEDSLMQRLSETITNVEAERTGTRNVLVNKQMEMIRAGNVLVSQLFSILQDIEAEELHNSEMDSRAATNLANNNISRINLVLIIFIVGSGLLIFLIFTDIARSNEYRRQLIAAKEEAEQLTQVKQRFLSNMSHELRTPLQTIIGFAEQMKGNTNIKQDEVNIIYQSSKHLLQTVNEVLDYSRITSGKFTFVNTTFNLYQILNEVTEAIKIEATRKSLLFNTDINISKQREYIGDPFRIKQILYNLLGNAIKFTASGSVSLAVHEKEVHGNNTFTFQISDTGIGIPEADIERIFNQFEQSSAQQNNLIEGTGLGLAIVKELTEGMQGSIVVESTEGRGSVFTIVLPLKKARETSDRHKQAVETSKQFNFPGEVWVVDDDPYILQLCKAIFEKYNVRHISFPDPQALLNYEYTTPPTLVFTDIRMPGITGIELCRALKERDSMNAAKIIALTAQALPSEDQQQANDCFDDILMKPFLEEHLLQILDEYRSVPQNSKAIKQSEQQGYNAFSSLIKMTDGEPALLNTILETFINETTSDSTQLTSAITNNDVNSTRHYLHKLAGRCGQTGANSISQKARRLEIEVSNAMSLQEDTTKNIHSLLSDIAQLITEAQNVQNKYPQK